MPEDKKNLTVRLSKSLIKKVKERAREEVRPISSQVEKMLLESLENTNEGS